MKSRSWRKLASGMVGVGGGFLLGFALAPALEHLEHAVGDQEATDDVDRPERDRDGAGDLRQGVGALGADHE